MHTKYDGHFSYYGDVFPLLLSNSGKVVFSLDLKELTISAH